MILLQRFPNREIARFPIVGDESGASATNVDAYILGLILPVTHATVLGNRGGLSGKFQLNGYDFMLIYSHKL